MTTVLRCADILGGEAPAETQVTVRGWVRTRRDSKAGISFVNVSDGSCFHPVQVVVPNTLAELCRRGPACHCGLRGRGDGNDRAFAREGAAVRDAGHRAARRGLGGGSRFLPHPAEAAFPRVPARRRASAAAHQRDRRRHARAPHDRAVHPSLLRRARLLLGQHAHHHVLRRRGRGRAVPRLDARLHEPAAHPGGQDRLHARISSAATPSSRYRASSTSRRTAWRCRRCTRSGRPSARRTRTRAATWRNSG